jgi:beta-glucosidase
MRHLWLTLLLIGCGASPERTTPDGGVDAASDMTALPQLGPGFLWGTATAAFQVEGGINDSDWSVWIAQGHAAEQQMVGAADDEYNRFDDDHMLAQQMGHNAYRLSFEWSRIEPMPGVYDQAAIQHYKKVLASARARGLKPVVTLEHYTLPKWVLDPSDPQASLGGWTNKQVADEFVSYVQHVVPAFVDDVDLWITLNEPIVQLTFGYFFGTWPPGELLDFPGTSAAMSQMLDGHARAFDVIHGIYATAGKPVQVTIAHNWTIVDPKTPGSDDAAAANLHHVLNGTFLDALTSGDYDSDLMGTIVKHPEWAHKLDLLGINFYQRQYVASGSPVGPLAGQPMVEPRGNPQGDNGWELYPDGMQRALEAAWQQYQLPILVTENGISDGSDTKRPWYLVQNIAAMQRAVGNGVPVLGYLHWSLIDNFEWTEGYHPRFGLVAVDFTTQARTPRPSAALYTQIIQANGVTPALLDLYATPPQ